ncbi:hypothetical protein KZ829_30570 [Actinoplanes hulinensis]|uniref:Uncharacterized protein n=1 Tax=Actinoplanes hulinensis TaxID=1144547 RepID=A0ABS7BB05_9ACTN|nr:hypothetical protein [Actinoplanes hulinensis]MBW6438082.1 hypothetical protein [Actinoplanes hulinensis]
MTRPLTPHLIRAVPWWPFAGAVLLAVVAQLPVLLKDPPPAMIVIDLRIAAAVLGAAAGFALPDLMASTVISPLPRWRRQWLRIALLLVPSVLVWGLLYLAVRNAAGPAVTWPHGFVILQAAVCGLLPVAAAAVGARYRDDASGALLGPVVQGVVLVVSLFFTDRSSPWLLPMDGVWTTAQRCWPIALALVLVTLLVANRETPATPYLTARREGGKR